MNYLAHLYLADCTATSFAGAVLGDFVRGRLDGRLGVELETGIALHRRVDSFTDSHPLVRGALGRFSPPLRRYAGILVDLYFDYALARRWGEFHRLALPDFAAVAQAKVQAQWPQHGAPFPAARLDRFAEMLVGYRVEAGMQRALTGIDERLSRPSPLPGAWPQVRAVGRALDADFEAFFPELVEFSCERASNFISRSGTPTRNPSS